MWASQVVQWVKNLPTVQETQETQVQSWGQEGPLEETIVTHSSTLVWIIPWTEEFGRLQSIGSQRVVHDWNNLACTNKHVLYKGKGFSEDEWKAQMIEPRTMEHLSPVPSLCGCDVIKQRAKCVWLDFSAPKSLQTLTAAMKLKHLLLGTKARTNPDNIFKNRDITLPTNVPSQSYASSSIHVQM